MMFVSFFKVSYFSSFVADFNFANYPPSMIAAGSVSAAASGLMGLDWVQKVGLLERLQKITSIDMVSNPQRTHLLWIRFTGNLFL